MTGLRATDQGAQRIRNGNPGDVTSGAEFGETVWVRGPDGPLCVGRYMGGQVHPDRVFNL